MKDYDAILFDLDGTLTDSQDGIIKALQHALGKFGLNHIKPEKLRSWIGPPLYESFKAFFDMDEEKARQAVEHYREYFARKGIYENRVFPGIPALLERLKGAGKRVILATSKPEFFAEKILRHFNLEQYFDLIAGSNMDGSRIVKKEIIQHIFEQMPALSKAEAVMVGDREQDIKGARAHGMDSVVVTYGYGTEEELKGAGPSYMVASVEELSSLLLGEKV